MASTASIFSCRLKELKYNAWDCSCRAQASRASRSGLFIGLPPKHSELPHVLTVLVSPRPLFHTNQRLETHEARLHAGQDVPGEGPVVFDIEIEGLRDEDVNGCLAMLFASEGKDDHILFTRPQVPLRGIAQ